jgi:hypothetical protein
MSPGEPAPILDQTRDQPADLVPCAPGPQGEAPLPERIGRFQIRRFLGEGVFGRVYEAFDPSLKRTVALKVAKPEQLHSAQRIARFLREARSAALLMHPNIVAVFDSGQDGAHYYIASAFIPGRSLASLLEELPEGQTLEVRQTVQIVRQLAEALSHAHRNKVIHRDVKPANVMLRQDGEPLLMDFGRLAARADEEEKLTQAGGWMGTPAYMAPEQWRGQAEAASDQYSLGCLLFELLTGQTPFSGGSPEHYLMLHQNQPAPSPRQVNPCVPRDLETICLKCLEKEPGRRYADCQELADDLRRWLECEPIQARRMGLVDLLVKWVRRRPAAAGLLGTVVLGTVLALVVRAGVTRLAGGLELEKHTREVIILIYQVRLPLAHMGAVIKNPTPTQPVLEQDSYRKCRQEYNESTQQLQRMVADYSAHEQLVGRLKTEGQRLDQILAEERKRGDVLVRADKLLNEMDEQLQQLLRDQERFADERRDIVQNQTRQSALMTAFIFLVAVMLSVVLVAPWLARSVPRAAEKLRRWASDPVRSRRRH